MLYVSAASDGACSIYSLGVVFLFSKAIAINIGCLMRSVTSPTFFLIALLFSCSASTEQPFTHPTEVCLQASGTPLEIETPRTEKRLPPARARFDYQLGCAYPPPSGVSVVMRDPSAPPAPGLYNICYINAFQTQSDADWSGARDELILRDESGRRMKDSEWNEYFLDISSAQKREALAGIIGLSIQDCSALGFDAVEFDNLDSFTRSHGLLTLEHAIAYARLLVERAQREHLAIAQKNAAEHSATFKHIGFDFAISEECWQYAGDCDRYTAAYGDRVFDIEYQAAAFETGCLSERWPVPILRDPNLVGPGPNYRRRECPQ